MSSLINFSMKNAQGTYDKYTMSINDKQDDYGNNASVWIAQTKEERESKQPKKYVGNGKVTWTDSTIIKAEFVEREQPKSTGIGMQASKEQDLPF